MGDRIKIEIPGSYSNGSYVRIPLDEPGVAANFDVATGDLVGLDFDSSVWTEEKADCLVNLIFSYLSYRSPFVKSDRKHITRSLVYKGGPGSGNFGHAGRPGQVGGSSSSGGRSSGATTSAVGNVNAICNNPEELPILKKYNMSKSDFEALLVVPGISDVSYFVEDSDGNLGVSASWFIDGEHIGDTGFTVSKRKSRIYIDYVAVDKKFEAAGVGAAQIKNFEKMASAAGVKKLCLYADISIGPYAWAKQGFDYADSEDLLFARDDLKDYVFEAADNAGLKLSKTQRNSIENSIGKLKSAKEVAEFDISELRMSAKDWSNTVSFENKSVPKKMMMHVGKAFMLDERIEGHGDWEAVKHIRPRGTKKKSFVPLLEVISISRDGSDYHIYHLDRSRVVKTLLTSGDESFELLSQSLEERYHNSVEVFCDVMGKFDPYFIGYDPPIACEFSYEKIAELYDEKFSFFDRGSKQEKGGPGSGNFGHSGRPGQVGGSSSVGGVSQADTFRLTDAQEGAMAFVRGIGDVNESSVDLSKYPSLSGVLTDKDVRDMSDMISDVSEVVIHRHMYPGSDSANDVKDTGYVKNQFQVYSETGSVSSSGYKAPRKGEARDRWEQKLFSEEYQSSDEYKSVERGSALPINLAVERPVYGTVRFKEADERADFAYCLRNTRDQYGQVELVLKKSVNDRSSVTIGDSCVIDYETGGPDSKFISGLSSLQNAAIVKSILRNVEIHYQDNAPILRDVIRERNKQGIATFATRAASHSSYFEAQVHGGVNLARDVASIRIPGSRPGQVNAYNYVIDIARKYNVPIYYRHKDASEKEYLEEVRD